MTRIVAALYIDPRGPYTAMEGVECWDEARDARLYDGPHPVVAHPPCGPWSKLRHLYKGAEHDCAPRALEQVRRWGGILEHPAHSLFFEAARLPEPGRLDGRGFTIEVNQVDWGHVARKPTWLYCVGVPVALAQQRPAPREPTHWCSGFRSASGKYPAHYKQQGCAVPPGIKVCSAQQRRRTPPLFAAWLVTLAQASAVAGRRVA